jgi:predicted ATPase
MARGSSEIWLRAVEIRGDEFPAVESYPFNVSCLRQRKVLDFDRSVSFFVGENGCGKSTLLEAVARRCGLHIWAEPKRRRELEDGTSRRGHGSLRDHLRVDLERSPVRGGVFSAETFKDWAEFLDDVTTIDPGQAKYHGGTDLTLRSHGEGLVAYFKGRYQIPGLYFLDEPEAALSPSSQLELLRLLEERRAAGDTQFIIATHSPILMALPEARVFDFGDGAITPTRYQDTAHYRLYRDFMADPRPFLEG